MLSDKRNAFSDFSRRRFIRMRKEDGRRIFNLVVKKFAKILHIHFAFSGINNRSIGIKLKINAVNTLNRIDYVRELTYAGGLYNYSVRLIIVEYLYKRT